MSRRKSPRGRQYAREQADLADALKSAPGLSAFTFDGPRRLPVLMICWIACTVPTMAGTTRRRLAGTGSPVSSGMRAGTSRRCSSSVTYWPGALSRINCYRAAFSSFALDWFVFGNAYLEMRRNRLHGPMGFVTHWRSTPGAVPTSTLTGLFSPGLPITSSRLVQCVMCSTRTSTEIYGMPEYFAGLLSANPHTLPTSSASSTTTTVARRLHCLR